MRIRGLGRLRSRLDVLLNTVQAQVVILLYHRIAEHVPDPQLLCVSPSHFAEHLEHLKRYYHPISLHQLKDAIQKGRIPHKAVVITFDDGYVDNFCRAKPLLEQYDWPATVFVVGGYVGTDREMISDQLERLLLESDTLPERLALTINSHTYSWELDGTGAQLFAWDVTHSDYPTLRHRCYHDLHRLLRSANHSTRQQVVEVLSDWMGSNTSVRPERRLMNVHELRELSKEGLIDIGAHTVSHVLLATQPVKTQRQEIVESKESLEQALGRPVTSFAYPYGGSNDVSQETVRLVQQAEFELACANVPAPVTRRSDLFWLPRYLVRDWAGEEFAQRLERAFHG